MIDDKLWKAHLHYLQLNESEYKAWCLKHGFRTSKKKSKNELLKEKEQKRKEWDASKEAKQESQDKEEKQAYRLKLEELAATVPRKKSEVLSELETINQKELIGLYSRWKDSPHEKAIVNCLKNKEFWINTLESWDCINTNHDKIVNNLVQHLFYKFRVSPFWVKAFYEGEQEARWAIEVAQGSSLKRLNKFPFKVSHKDALAFEKHLDAEFSFKQGLVYALVMSWSENYYIAKAASNSQLSEKYFNNETKAFWEQFFTLFKYQMFDHRHIRELIDYLIAQRFSSTPLNPDFTLKGKTIATLYRAAMEWHEVERMNRAWQGRTNREFTKTFEDWSLDLSSLNDRQVWTIQQLTSDKELYHEGDAMHHCVFTYGNSCFSGHCTIHSLRKNGIRVATIELRGKHLAQAKLKYNHILKTEERLVLEEWMRKEKISFNNLHW